MKTIRLNKDTWLRVVGGTRRFVVRIPHIILIDRFMMVRFILLSVLGIVALMAVVSLLYLWGEGVQETTGEQDILLNIETIDQLELWL